MGIISFDEARFGRTASDTEDERRYTRAFVAVADSITTSPKEIREHGLCPRVGQGHPEDGFAKVTLVDPQLRDVGNTVWDVFVEYSHDKTDPSSEGDSRSVDTLRPRVRSYSMARGKEITSDVSGNPFMASNRIDHLGSLTIDESIMRFEFSGVISVAKYQIGLKKFVAENVNGKNGLQNKVNSVVMFGFSQGMFKLSAISGTMVDVSINGTNVSKMDAQIVMDLAVTWSGKFIDRGRYQLKEPLAMHFDRTESADPNNSKGQLFTHKILSTDVTPIMDASGEQYSEPVLLNGFGQPLERGQAPVPLKVKTYDKANIEELFRSFGFPLNINGYGIQT